MEWLNCSLEVKDLAENGSFEGYGSVFGVKDLGGDIVEAGAFRKTLSARGARGIKMLADHDRTKRIGVWTEINEDAKGLFVKGRLLTEKVIGQEAYIDLKAGALDGLSIGYVTKESANDGRRRARLLKEVDLFEISLVTFPMNPDATVTRVKSDFDPREQEAALREAGLSRSDAVKAVATFRKWLQREAGEPGTSPRDEDEAVALLRRNIAILSR